MAHADQPTIDQKKQLEQESMLLAEELVTYHERYGRLMQALFNDGLDPRKFEELSMAHHDILVQLKQRRIALKQKRSRQSVTC